MAKLTSSRVQVLRAFKQYGIGEGWLQSSDISHYCKHSYNPAWAAGKIRALKTLGLVEVSGIAGWYRITPAGRAALSQEGE